MSRIHIPFRFGAPCTLSAEDIRAKARHTRGVILNALEAEEGGDPDRSFYASEAIKVFGGRMRRVRDEEVSIQDSLSMEVWMENDFVIHEPDNILGLNNSLRLFALLGSYILHYRGMIDTWVDETGTVTGMQWAYHPDHPGAFKGLCAQEAYTFAWELVAPRAEMEKAIARFGDKYPLHFHMNMRPTQARQRAVALGLVSEA